jgi:uncharacterized membrane protein YfcA
MSIIELGPIVWAFIAFAFLVGGTVKGVIGIGMPLVVVPSVASFVDPLTGIMLISVPVLLTNGWQATHGGYFLPMARRFGSLILVMMVVVSIATLFLVKADASIAAITMGGIIMLYTIIRKFPIKSQPSRETERWLSPLVGVVTGIIVGTTGLLSPPLTIYLATLRLPKEEFVSAIALLLIFGALPLFTNLAIYGVLTFEVLIASCIAVIPGSLGVLLGTKIRARVSQTVFEQVLFVVLFLIGLNLLVRGLL